ncbi:hypothetical protein [Curtobacterium sp. BRD11]|uniref:hypothetical protein n=1 Tax=Curtobacterium sp. BRD11 TaxID=2962581 RepID=UPI002880CE14|nr:hypothetical protein [Curtobacterium sp. BRD11]MDT0212204.1 hypothetical protein [Curtobacterium sp. BRD11]
MKRSFSLPTSVLLASGLGLVAATYGLVRLAFGLFLPDVQRDLGFGADVGGAVSSGASVLYCTGAVVGFLLADRAARWLVVVAALTAGLGAITTAASATTLVFGWPPWWRRPGPGWRRRRWCSWSPAGSTAPLATGPRRW